MALDPENAQAWTGLMPLYLWGLAAGGQNLAQAQAAADKALELDPENPEALVRMAPL